MDGFVKPILRHDMPQRTWRFPNKSQPLSNLLGNYFNSAECIIFFGAWSCAGAIFILPPFAKPLWEAQCLPALMRSMPYRQGMGTALEGKVAGWRAKPSGPVCHHADCTDIGADAANSLCQLKHRRADALSYSVLMYGVRSNWGKQPWHLNCTACR